ncbi:hypothetical protein [Leptospira andrefontaineae]|uniref:Uncharacterized protein n=1 Tax=Leptospira andrefontaineae TaxID=2484976 RepID=A0A4R9GX07_9LEPT|nr:hypothetical protein [Leptospira andrefontaineae]TGK36227.1 hypothetical protein EHO65_18145 [Leptospira andrefontaineae]
MAISTSTKHLISIDLIPASHETFKALHYRRDPIQKSTFVKKDASGRERKYVVGTSSGSLKRDAHTERMTDKCVKGFEQQSKEKSILLVHPHTDNLLENQIGILDDTQSFIDEQGEWKTVFRLFDDFDVEDNPNFDIAYVKKAKQFWAMTRGEEPYKRPTRICQFSIQGLLDEKDVIKTESGNDLDWIEIDAVAAVTRGAYPQEDFSTIEKVFKQFHSAKEGKPKPVSKGELSEEIQARDRVRNFYDETWETESALSKKEQEVLESEDTPENKQARLTALYDEYRDLRLGMFAKYNFNFPDNENESTADSATGDNMGDQATSTDPSDEDKNKDNAGGDPAAGGQQPASDDQKQALAQQVQQALNQLGEIFNTLLNPGQGSTEQATAAKESEDGKQDDDPEKKKNKDAVSEMADPNVESEINKTAANLKKLGVPDNEIKRITGEIRKAANPMLGMNSELAVLKKQLADQNNVLVGLCDIFDKIATVGIVNKQAPPPKQGGQSGQPATVGQNAEVVIKALSAPLATLGVELVAKPQDQSQPPNAQTTVKELRETLKKSFPGEKSNG